MQTRLSDYSNYTQGRIFLLRLPHEADLLKWLNQFAVENGLKAGAVSVIGAVKRARVAFYNQQDKTYREIDLKENLEILSCIGDISVKENAPFVHCHATFSNSRAETFGGHLAEGTTVFAAEAFFQELLGTELVREHDSETGLTLWRQP